MFNRFLGFVLVTAFFAGSLYAHGDPIMGTVTAIGADSFTIKDRNNKVVTIALEKVTKYVKSDKPVTKSDLQVGVRVIIDAHMDTKLKMLAAEEVNIGSVVPAAPVRK